MKNKIIGIIICSLMIITVIPMTSADEDGNIPLSSTMTFYSKSSDGYIFKEGSSYISTHHASDGDVVDGPENTISIGQLKDDGIFTINRGFLFFDTSDLPDDCEILSATLSLYGKNDYALPTMNINVMKGEPSVYPHDPLEAGDFNYNYYWSVGGFMNADNWVVGDYNGINLNSVGQSCIETGPGALSKFCLRSNRDLGMAIPQTYEYVVAYSSEKGSGYKPKLTVEYSVPNSPPNPPSNPSPGNGATGVGINADLSWTCNDPDGDSLVYDVYFGESSIPPKVKDDQTGNSYNPGTMDYLTTYYWKIVAKDEHDAETTSPVWHFTTKDGTTNDPPNKPSKPEGMTNINMGVMQAYWSYAIDPNGDNVQMRFDWGDGTTSGWSEPPVQSGKQIFLNHIWESPGKFNIKAQAKDINGAKSSWSDPLQINVIDTNYPPNKPIVPAGPTFRTVFETGTYTTSTYDPEGSKIDYRFNLGDGYTTPWMGPFNGGEPCDKTYCWSRPGYYLVKSQAKDESGKTSDWSEDLMVKVNGYGDPKDFFAIAISEEKQYLQVWVQTRNMLNLHRTLFTHLGYYEEDFYSIDGFGGKRPTKENFEYLIYETKKVTDENTNILVYMNGDCLQDKFCLNLHEKISAGEINQLLSKLEYNTLTIVLEGRSVGNLISALSGEDRIVIASAKVWDNANLFYGSLFTNSFLDTLKLGRSYGKCWEEADKDICEITNNLWLRLLSFILLGGIDAQCPLIDDNGDGVAHGTYNAADILPKGGDGNLALESFPYGPEIQSGEDMSSETAFNYGSNTNECYASSEKSSTNTENTAETIIQNTMNPLQQETSTTFFTETNVVSDLQIGTNMLEIIKSEGSSTKNETGELKITIVSTIPEVVPEDLTVATVNMKTYEIYPIFPILSQPGVYRNKNLPVGKYQIMAGNMNYDNMVQTNITIDEKRQTNHTFFVRPIENQETISNPDYFPNSGEIKITVKQKESDEPLKDSFVIACNLITDDWYLIPQDENEIGVFIIDSLPEGRYFIGAGNEGFQRKDIMVGIESLQEFKHTFYLESEQEENQLSFVNEWFNQLFQLNT